MTYSHTHAIYGCGVVSTILLSMGSLLSSHRVDVLVPELNRNHPYVYVADEGGRYFSSHYHLGSRKFECPDNEHFLFGEMNEINYITAPPTAFPYRQPPKRKPVEILNSLLNIHKETIKLIKLNDNDEAYTVEFSFDADVPCQVYIFNWLLDVSLMNSLKEGNTTSAVTKVSERFSFGKGLEQTFKESSMTLTPADWMEDKLDYDLTDGQNFFPVAILMETSNDTSRGEYQSLLTACKLEKSSNGGFSIKVLKQKLFIDDMEYVLHEIFGLENKAISKDNDNDGDNDGDGDGDGDDSSDDDEDDLGAECVICFTDVKDTILLPCRHLCICASCAADLRYQASNCPICRSPFQALLQIQALQPLDEDEHPDDDEITDNPELYSVPGHKTVSLIQAVNGYPKIKPVKANSSGLEVTLSTGDEEEEDEMNTDTNTDTIIPIDPQTDIEEEHHVTPHGANGLDLFNVVTVTASIESEATGENHDDNRDRLPSTVSNNSSIANDSLHSSISNTSLHSRDALLLNNS